VEEIIFPPPFGKLEAFQTAGGSSTLPITFYGRVKNLDYKTIRYPGHSQIFQTLISLGLCSSEEIIINGLKVTPRKITGLLLEKALRGEGKDAVLMSIAIDGTVGGKNRSLTYRMIDYYDDKTNLTAMMRSTGFPSAIIAQMLAEGKIEKKGVVPQELSVPPEQFVQEIARRNLKLEEIWN
jgi:lysine 6-dehydrogenase